MQTDSNLIDVGGVMCLPIVTSHSIDGTFGFCQRKFEFAHVYQQVPEAGSVGLAAEAGTAMHEAVQAWARVALMPDTDRGDLEVRLKAEQAGLWELMLWWPWILEEVSLEQKKRAATERSLTAAIQLFYSIIQSPFWDEYELATTPDGKPAIEIPWRIIHAKLGVIQDQHGRNRVLVTQGKVDFILRHRTVGRLLVVDLKTTNKLDNLLHAAFRYSGQGLGYSFVVAAALNFPIDELGIEVAYLVASFSDFRIQPLTFKISPQEIDDYKATRMDLLMDMKRNLLRQWWPRRQHGCDSYMSACPYLDVCHRRDPKFIGMWFAAEESPFVERPRIYETIWNFTD